MNLGGDFSADEAIQMAREYGVEALVLLSPTLPMPFVRAFESTGLTVIQAFDFKSQQPIMSQGAVADAAAGRLAARTLEERGYRRLAFLGGPRSDKSVRDPFPGFRAVCERRGIKLQLFRAKAWTYQAGFNAMQHILKSTECDACFCASDLLGIGALAALRKNGRQVPDEFGLIGLDDIAMSAWHDIDLTTIRIPRNQIARHCINLMLEERDDPNRLPESRLIKPRLIERATLRPSFQG
ncbi:MAG TPA: substrate-binding domain-containing protein [Sphingomonadaceae bacterium]|nr:substrate-binding domain-containing protein [Sphingomonadaceae bacterium]